MKPSLLPRGVLIAVLFLFVRASSAISARKLINGAGALVDELNDLRTRLVESTGGFRQPQWARKLQQSYYPTASYGDYGYGYGYYGYYGAYSGGGGHDYMMMGRRLMSDGSASGEGNHARALKQAYPYPYGYGGYYGYYYGGYGGYGGYGANPYTSYQMMNGRRRVLGSVERLAELLVDETDGFVKPGDRTLLAEEGVEDPRRALQQMPYDAYPTSSYGYAYGYGYYYGGSYVNPYQW